MAGFDPSELAVPGDPTDGVDFHPAFCLQNQMSPCSVGIRMATLILARRMRGQGNPFRVNDR